MTPEAWSAIAAWTAVVIAIFTIYVTANYAKKQVAAALGQLDEAKATREEQAQPNVVAFTEPNDVSWQILEIVVKNFGTTPAFDIELDFDEPLTVSPTYSLGDYEHVRIPEVIPILAPGQEWRTTWDSAIRREETLGLDDHFTGTVRYRDSKQNSYSTPAIFEWASLKTTMRLEQKGTHHISKTLSDQLPKVVRNLDKLQQRIGSLQEEYGGVWVYHDSAEPERERRAEEQRRQEERHQRAVERLRSLGPTKPTANREAPRSEADNSVSGEQNDAETLTDGAIQE